MEFQKFIILFNELRQLCGDPRRLHEIASHDEAFRNRCHELASIALFFRMDERGDRSLFRSGVNSAFIKEWREYENNWELAVSEIAWAEILELLDCSERASKDEFTSRWEQADERARSTVGGLNDAMERAVDSVEVGDFSDSYVENLEQSKEEIRLLRKRTGVDLRGIFRRRQLVPMTLIPTQVSMKHGRTLGHPDNKKLSLKLQLREAQEAFIFGLPLATVSHMRAVMELVLTHHYEFSDKELSCKIDGLSFRPIKAALHRLRMLANDVLHSDNRGKTDPMRERHLKDRGSYAASLASGTDLAVAEKGKTIAVEKELLVYLRVLRDLIEAAP